MPRCPPLFALALGLAACGAPDRASQAPAPTSAMASPVVGARFRRVAPSDVEGSSVAVDWPRGEVGKADVGNDFEPLRWICPAAARLGPPAAHGELDVRFDVEDQETHARLVLYLGATSPNLHLESTSPGDQASAQAFLRFLREAPEGDCGFTSYFEGSTCTMGLHGGERFREFGDDEKTLDFLFAKVTRVEGERPAALVPGSLYDALLARWVAVAPRARAERKNRMPVMRRAVARELDAGSPPPEVLSDIGKQAHCAMYSDFRDTIRVDAGPVRDALAERIAQYCR